MSWDIQQTADKSPHFLIPKIEKFSRQLSSRYSKEINFVDERLSSHATVDYALEVRKLGLDAVAAKLILETWLSELESLNYDNRCNFRHYETATTKFVDS